MSAWWDTERELPVAPEPRTCLLCGLEATSATIWLKPAWWREPLDGREVTTIPRCLDIDACRRRVADAGERWLLLETGEEPGRRRREEIGSTGAPIAPRPARGLVPPLVPSEPMQAPQPAPPDADVDEEAPVGIPDYF
jgi:hypothetical protein